MCDVPNVAITPESNEIQVPTNLFVSDSPIENGNKEFCNFPTERRASLVNETSIHSSDTATDFFTHL